MRADWKGQPRSNDTHASTTDPDARLYRKSHNTASMLCYQGHALMENRTVLVVGAVVSHADGFGERRAALAMLDAMPTTASRRSVGADKAYDAADRGRVSPAQGDTPRRGPTIPVAAGAPIDGRTTRHPSYRISQIIRKRIEEPFGWGKTIGRIRQTVFRGLQRVDQQSADHERQQLDAPCTECRWRCPAEWRRESGEPGRDPFPCDTTADSRSNRGV